MGAALLAACASTATPGGGGSGSPAVSSITSSGAGSVPEADGRALVVLAVYQPVCGPERVTPDPLCAQEPVPDVMVTATLPDGSVVARATTDAQGRAVFDLPEGTYVLSASAAAPPRIAPRPTQVTVGAPPRPTVTLRYESSMQ